MNYLQNEFTVITGASSSFRETTARKLAARVVLLARNEDKLSNIARQIRDFGSVANFSGNPPRF